MSTPLLVYGATGFTGGLVVHAARERGLAPILCGRRGEALEAMARKLGLAHRVARMDDPDALDSALQGVEVVLHCAGPFTETGPPMIDACLRSGAHYLDVTGEITAIETARTRDAEARARAVTVMPGVGFDVVPSDGLAAHVARRLPDARSLAIAITGLGFATRGSARTLMAQAGTTVKVRRGGQIKRVRPLSDLRSFDFGQGPRPCVNVSWGDVASAWYTTGIPDISVYFDQTPVLNAMAWVDRMLGPLLRTGPAQAVLKSYADLIPAGPPVGLGTREGTEMVIVAEAKAPGGRAVCSRLFTPEAYAFTGTVAAALAERVLDGDFEPGFQTPGRVYGPDFTLRLPGVRREDVPPAARATQAAQAAAGVPWL